MKSNIYVLYLTFSNSDRDIFNKILLKLATHNKSNIVIVHIKVNHNENIITSTHDNFKTDLLCDVIFMDENNNTSNIIHTKIHNIKSIIKYFKLNNSSGRNIFVYSGHSDGILFGHRKALLYSIKNFCKIIKKTIKDKCDMIFGDACLMGNINALNYCRKVSKYVIASPEYYDYTSVLETQAIHNYYKDNITYGKKVIKEYANIVKNLYSSKYIINISLYEINEYLDDLIHIVKKYKDNIKYSTCAINKTDYYYVDILCGLKNIDNIDKEIINNVEKYMSKIVKYNYNNIKETGYKMLIILKNPYIKKISYYDPFFKRIKR